MTKTMLIIGNTTGLVTNEKIEQERALDIAIKSFYQSGYQVLLLTENRESMINFSATQVTLIYKEITVSNINALIKQYQVDYIFPCFNGNNTFNVFRNLLKDPTFQASETQLLSFNLQNLTLSLSKRSLNKYLQEHNFRLIEHQNVQSYEEALRFSQKQNFPVLIRANMADQKAYWNTINNSDQLAGIFQVHDEVESFEIERGINNFKELTLVTIRDKFDNSAMLYSSEDMDPIGVHSNDSTSVAPVFSITDTLFQRLRDAVLKLTTLLKIVGICTFHLAVDEESESFYVLEISPTFRSKMVPLIENLGYPLFEVMCQVSDGKRLQEVTTLNGKTFNAAVELTASHLTARIPTWQSDRQENLQVLLGPHQTSTGAIIVNGDNLESLTMKAFNALELTMEIFWNHPLKFLSDEQLEADLFRTKVNRILVVCEAMGRGFDLHEIQSFTHYNLMFLQALEHLFQLAQTLCQQKGDLDLLVQGKIYGFDNQLIAKFWHLTLEQAQQLVSQLPIQQIQQPTPTLFDLPANNQVQNYYSTYLYDQPQNKRFQIEINNYQTADALLNYQQFLLAHHLLVSFRDDGFSTAVYGNLLTKSDAKTDINFYMDTLDQQHYLYSHENSLQLKINTQETHQKLYHLTIFNFDSYLNLEPSQPFQEVVFIQDTNHQTWLSSPLTLIFRKNGGHRKEFTAIPGKHTAKIVKLVNRYIKKRLPQIPYGTLILKNQRVVQVLAGFTPNIGLIQQINSNFVTTLGHVLLGVNSKYSNKQQDYFGRKVTLIHHKNGLYSSRVNYFELPSSSL
ncbi:hypothetical protein MOO45_04385 [Bombilactobacillus folatiphilus]|uniref:carbamoyl-phosphate synthase (ammonia) n=1 Tax=Bombilactobacillus folatiphilus TaxID=2923362 RepID=A0ABY4P6W9_9LACO|nr:hypothetical protein [Bombilactobacillus folatiphilus]UQS81469.1 hypothetical protein MOO45_04385 [Bombilactobacillus folatiphilus]